TTSGLLVAHSRRRVGACSRPKPRGPHVRGLRMRCPGTRSPQSIQISMRRGAVYPRGTSAARRSNVSFSPRPSPTARSASAAISCVTSQVYLDRRSEEHTSELQSLRHLVCRLLLEKKKKNKKK